jgi:hypothetical protein
MAPGDPVAIFSCGPLAVLVTAPHEVLEHVAAYFPRRTGGGAACIADVAARVVAPAELVPPPWPLQAMAQGHPQLAYQVHPDGAGGTALAPQSGPPHLITVTADCGHVGVAAADPAVLATTVTRVLRQLVIRHAERAGGLLGHAAAVAPGKGGVMLLAGRPGVGKTTMALILARGGAALCSGDRTILLPRPGGWHAAEVPLAWRVAPGTLDALDLASPAAALPARARGRGLADGKHEFTAAELCDLTGAARVPCGRATAIVVLNQDPSRPAAARLALDPAAALARTLFRPEDALFTTDWLGLGTPAPGEAAARRGALAAQVPVIEATWPDHAALPSLARLLNDQAGLRQSQDGTW